MSARIRRARVRDPHGYWHFSPVQALYPDSRTLGIPGFRQVRNYTCGYATALMVVRYFGREISGRELYETLGTGRDGTRQNAIVRALRRLEISANVRYDMDFSAIRRSVDRGKLVIVYHHQAEHWMLLYGYGEGPERVFVADPRPDAGCVHEWRRYRTMLRGFGIVCSARPTCQPIAAIPPRPRAADSRSGVADRRWMSALPGADRRSGPWDRRASEQLSLAL